MYLHALSRFISADKFKTSTFEFYHHIRIDLDKMKFLFLKDIVKI